MRKYTSVTGNSPCKKAIMPYPQRRPAPVPVQPAAPVQTTPAADAYDESAAVAEHDGTGQYAQPVFNPFSHNSCSVCMCLS